MCCVRKCVRQPGTNDESTYTDFCRLMLGGLSLALSDDVCFLRVSLGAGTSMDWDSSKKAVPGGAGESLALRESTLHLSLVILFSFL